MDGPAGNAGARAHPSDEELSAFVDGVLAREDSRRVVEHVEGCAPCSRRRVELARAAGLLRSATVDPVDVMTRRRLIDHALEASEPLAEATPGPSRFGQWFGHPATAAVAAVAAAVFVVIGFISFDRPGDGGSDSKGAKDSLAAAQAAAEGHFLGNIGEIGDPKRLRSAIADAATGESQAANEAELGEQREGVTSPAAGDAAPLTSPASELPAESNGDAESKRQDDSSTTQSDREAVGRCAQTTQLSLDSTVDEGEGAFKSTLTFSAVGAYQGSAAVILVYTTPSGGQQIFVVARDDCTILSFQGSPATP